MYKTSECWMDRQIIKQFLFCFKYERAYTNEELLIKVIICVTLTLVYTSVSFHPVQSDFIKMKQSKEKRYTVVVLYCQDGSAKN